jgi:hypothetical protein
MYDYSHVPNDIHISCSSYSQNRHLLDGASVLDWLSEKGQKFICFIYELEGVGGIPKTSHVFLELTLDV